MNLIEVNVNSDSESQTVEDKLLFFLLKKICLLIIELEVIVLLLSKRVCCHLHLSNASLRLFVFLCYKTLPFVFVSSELKRLEMPNTSNNKEMHDRT